MGRKIRSTLPMATHSLVPQWSYLDEFQQANERFKRQQKQDYDRRHRVRDLPEIPDNTDVWVTTGGNPVAGRTVNMSSTPRSYVVHTPSGEIRRNRSHLNINPSTQNREDIQTTNSEEQRRSPIVTRSRSGISITPPDRLA